MAHHGKNISQVPSAAGSTARRTSNARKQSGFDYIKITLVACIALVGLFVALSPSLVFAKVPQVVLFFMISLLFAILFLGEIVSRMEVRLPFIVVTGTGVFGAFIGLLFVLAHLAKPEFQVAKFSINNKQGHPVELSMDRVSVKSIFSPVPAEYFVRGNEVLIIFPDQSPRVILEVSPFTGELYRCEVTYGGNRAFERRLDRDLQRVQ